ncbi:MAG TPA: hypothetical protein VOA80_01485 [Thermoanaerobaculia bacterium]|nr:hypothetical protein [Thermoanaerobaculia bacterium]
MVRLDLGKSKHKGKVARQPGLPARMAPEGQVGAHAANARNRKVSHVSGNKCFSSRRDDSYLRLLHDHLAIERLKATSVPPSEGGAWIVNGSTFARRCTISFLGIAGRNFFDRNRAFLRDGDHSAILTSDLEEVFKCHQSFLADDIWLRVRFLFVYPYSTFAMSIINAETTTRRSSIARESIHPTSQVELHVDEDRFKGSSLFQSQRLALKTIQQWGLRLEVGTWAFRSCKVHDA